MKTLIGSAAAALLMAATPALAADLGRPAPPPAPAPAVAPARAFDWTGFYLGVNGGYGWGTGSGQADYLGLKQDGWFGGGQIGVNYQFGNNVVLGAEADIAASDFSDSVGGVQSKLDYFGTVRGRLGYAFENVLPYVTGGLAWGHNEISYDGLKSDNTPVGWTVGAGLEYALTNNWTVKAEYLYMDLGDDYYNSLGSDAGVKENIARFGVNYKF